MTSTTTLVAFSAGVITLGVCLAALWIWCSRRLRRRDAHDLCLRAHEQAFEEMSDAAVVVDTRLHVVLANSAARRLFPRMRPGDAVAEHCPPLTTHMEHCLVSDLPETTFETLFDGTVLWGRAIPLVEGETSLGCLVLLADLTDLRAAQTELIRLGHDISQLARARHDTVRLGAPN